MGCGWADQRWATLVARYWRNYWAGQASAGRVQQAQGWWRGLWMVSWLVGGGLVFGVCPSQDMNANKRVITTSSKTIETTAVSNP